MQILPCRSVINRVNLVFSELFQTHQYYHIEIHNDYQVFRPQTKEIV
jgi:hypothetical protein